MVANKEPGPPPGIPFAFPKEAVIERKWHLFIHWMYQKKYLYAVFSFLMTMPFYPTLYPFLFLYKKECVGVNDDVDKMRD